MAKKSPVPTQIVKKAYLTFPDAMREVINGKRVTREEWNDINEYGELNKESLIIHTKGQDHTWMISSGDMLNNDWLVVSDHN